MLESESTLSQPYSSQILGQRDANIALITEGVWLLRS